MGRMLISREAERYATIDAAKVRSGRFLTRRDGWLRAPVLEFLRSSEATELVDPFAGEGHLFTQLAEAGFDLPTIGYDIAPEGAQVANDSLRSIPAHPTGAIVTNPPYLARHSASRKGVLRGLRRYYNHGGHTDLYQVAIRRALDAAPWVIAIVPETFLHANVLRDRLTRVVVVGAQVFDDTTTPVCVACFGPAPRASTDIDVFLDDDRLGSMAELDAVRRVAYGDADIRFNAATGNIALQAVDGVTPGLRIGFLPRSERDYDAAGIKHSSRLVTFLEVPGIESAEQVALLCERANEHVAALRTGIGELALSPFKGNDSTGARRRRLDYRQARWLLTCAVRSTR